MFSAIILGHRLAFVLLCALVVGAAIPLAAGWARLLPEDAPPFAGRNRSTSSEEEASAEETAIKRKDPFAVFLLVVVSLSYVFLFPGLPAEAVVRWLSTLMPESWLHWGLLAGRAFFVVTPGLAACYSVVRPSSLSIPLIGAGILILLLWLLEPMLFAAMIAS